MVVPCKGRRKTTRTLIRHGKSLKIPSAAFHLLLSLGKQISPVPSLKCARLREKQIELAASLCLGSEKAPPTHPGIGEEGGGEGGHGIEDEEEDEYDEEDGSGEGEDGGRANGGDATLSNLDDSNLQVCDGNMLFREETSHSFIIGDFERKCGRRRHDHDHQDPGGSR